MTPKLWKLFGGTFVVVTILAAAAYATFSSHHFYLQIHGESMIPTFEDGDRVIFEKVDKPAKDDFILFNLPKAWENEWLGEDSPRFIKRIAAAPGDTVAWDGNTWYANGEAFSSVQAGSCYVVPTKVVLKKGEYFVTGDTTVAKTLDSRETFCKELPYLVNAEDVLAVGAVKHIF